MSNAMTVVDKAALTFSEMEKLADYIAKSGLFGMKTKEQALVLMAISQAEGRHPALAARDYDIINGRPAKKAEAMHRDFLAAGGAMKWHNLTDTTADATFLHPQGGEVRITWDMERANKAGFGGKENYKKFPRQMLRSRTVSEGVRTVWPLATSGMYVPEEAAEFTGQTIEAEPEPPMRAAAASMPRPERVYAPEEPAGNGLSPEDERRLEGWRIAFRDARDTEAVRRLEGSMRYTAAIEHAPAPIVEALRAMCAQAYLRVQPKAETPPAAPTEPRQPVENAPENAAADAGDGWPG